MSSGGTTTTLDLAIQLIVSLTKDVERIRLIWENLRNTPENAVTRRGQAQEVSRKLGLSGELDEEIALDIAAIALRLVLIELSPLKNGKDAWFKVSHPKRGSGRYLWLGETDENGMVILSNQFGKKRKIDPIEHTFKLA